MISNRLNRFFKKNFLQNRNQGKEAENGGMDKRFCWKEGPFGFRRRQRMEILSWRLGERMMESRDVVIEDDSLSLHRQLRGIRLYS